MGQARVAIKKIVFSLSRQWPTGSRNASASSSPHRRMRPTDAPAEGSMESTLPTRLNGRQRLQLVAKGRHPTAGFHDGRFFVCQTAATCPIPPPISSLSSDRPVIAAQWSAPCRHAVTPSRRHASLFLVSNKPKPSAMNVPPTMRLNSFARAATCCFTREISTT